MGFFVGLASVVTKSGIIKDDRDTPMRRVRHRDGRLLRGGIGLTTGLGWSDRWVFMFFSVFVLWMCRRMATLCARGWSLTTLCARWRHLTTLFTRWRRLTTPRVALSSLSSMTSAIQGLLFFLWISCDGLTRRGLTLFLQ
jgi:hypothetical protein